MSNKLRRWEAALMAGVAIALLCGMCLDLEQAELAGSVIRLHVIANSDSDADQQLKLQVRDAVLERARELYREGDSLEQTRQRLEDNLDVLAAAGQAVVEAQGYDSRVTAGLERTWFPTKQYDGFALPAGCYTALRVVIGEGEGQNWWCVVFPPLCLGSATQTVEQAAQAGQFSGEQAALITGENDGYVIKFKAMELWEQFKLFLDGIF